LGGEGIAGVRTAFWWFALIAAAGISYTFGTPPWLQTMALIGMAFAVAIAFANLEEKLDDLRFDLAALKEDGERKDQEIAGLASRIRDLERSDPVSRGT
jgi:hypothetical protein